jgi:MFS family permease
MQSTGVFYGWKIVAVSFLVAAFAWGLGFYGPSIYVNELVRTNGWPVTIVSGAVTFHFLFSAALVIYLADAHARFGLVATTRAGIVAFGLGAIAWAHAIEPWQLYPAAALTGIGWAATSGAAVNAFVSPWFLVKRPLALSHAYNGASIGGVVFTPLWVALIAAIGFKGASIIIAGFGGLLLWLIVGETLSRTPQSLGLHVDDLPPHADAAPPPPPSTPRSRASLLADPRILTLSIGFAIGIFAQMGLITHLVVRLSPVLGDFGAAVALSMATICAIVGRFTLVAFIGASGRRRAAAVNFLIQACGVALLIVGETPLPLIAGCILFGLGIGNLLSLPPLILQSEQDPVDLGRALALLTAINQVLYAFAPGALGFMRDLTGSYTIPFILAGVTQVISAAIVVGGGRKI